MTPAQYDVLIEADGKMLAKLIVSLRVVPPRHVAKQLDGFSGIGQQFGQKYSVCVAPPASGYALIETSVKASLSGDRACNAWSTCETSMQEDRACLTFSMQGHSEFNPDQPHLSTGHISADYAVRARAPSLKSADAPVGVSRH